MQPTPAPCTETCIFRKEDCGQKASLHAAARFKDYANIAENRLSEYWIFWQHKPGPGAERGYFGPWQTCKQLLYGRERCGPLVTRFRPVLAVWIAGMVASGGVVLLAIFCVLSIFQMAMVSSKEKVVMSYSAVVIGKLALSLLASFLASFKIKSAETSQGIKQVIDEIPSSREYRATNYL
uniref:Uncharacterized protein n=1 Tax=Timema poppense TaxID=170557 RepID=A0A7R9GXY9_TIMPO|nr:unnamed protein product [Timema poppensis]